jgi:hypothetical protein
LLEAILSDAQFFMFFPWKFIFFHYIIILSSFVAQVIAMPIYQNIIISALNTAEWIKSIACDVSSNLLRRKRLEALNHDESLQFFITGAASGIGAEIATVLRASASRNVTLQVWRVMDVANFHGCS